MTIKTDPARRSLLLISLAVYLWASGATQACSEPASTEPHNTPAPGPAQAPQTLDPALAQFLARLEQKSAERKTIEVRYKVERYDRFFSWEKNWKTERELGRLILSDENRVAILQCPDNDGKEQILAWRRGAFGATRPGEILTACLYRDPEKTRDIPLILALPYFFRTSVKEVESQYQLKQLKDTDRYVLIQAAPISKLARDEKAEIYLWIDKSTLLPMVLQLRKVNSVATYWPTELKINQPLPDDILSVLSQKSWTDNKPEPWTSKTWFASFFESSW